MDYEVDRVCVTQSSRNFFSSKKKLEGNPFIQSRKVYIKTHMKMTCPIPRPAGVKSCAVFGR
jgi:hypothetical protein